MSLKEILAFTTILDSIPPLGFEKELQLQFLHQDDSFYPKANTCSVTLNLPVVHGTYADFNEFMCYGIQNGMVFGST